MATVNATIIRVFDFRSRSETTRLGKAGADEMEDSPIENGSDDGAIEELPRFPREVS